MRKPLIPETFSVRTFWTVVIGMGLLGVFVGYQVSDALAGGSSSGERTQDDGRAAMTEWVRAQQQAPLDELARDAERLVAAVETLGDPAFLPAIERLAIAVLEEDPAVEGQRVAIAKRIVERFAFLPASPSLERLRSRLELVR
ncbi:MAG: hypothetical protein HZB39_12695 [Planctomycetes bacterium]|nr:hypothetical protein [Planctomycetota bacterium]